MALPKVTEPIAGQWPVSVAWRGWLESLDRRVASIATAPAPEAAEPYVPQLQAGDGLTLWNNLAPGNVATMQLALLADTGVGASLVKITRDQYGRVAGTEAVTLADLPADGAAEGNALVFTAGAWAPGAASGAGGGEILIQNGSSAPPVMLTNEAEDDFLYAG